MIYDSAILKIQHGTRPLSTPQSLLQLVCKVLQLNMDLMGTVKTVSTSTSKLQLDPTLNPSFFQSSFGCRSMLNKYGKKLIERYGGSFTSGTSSFYDGSVILAQSIKTQQPVIYVSINYRLGAFGFLNGKESSENGAANLGLRDVQKSLEWVQQNIWAWGGDPDRVTVFGQSAGSILISLLYLQPQLNLFRGAIMESGAQSSSPIGPTSEVWQKPYDLLVQYTGCGNGTNSSSFDCLKNLPAQQLLQAQQQVKNISIYSLA